MRKSEEETGGGWSSPQTAVPVRAYGKEGGWMVPRAVQTEKGLAESLGTLDSKLAVRGVSCVPRGVRLRLTALPRHRLGYAPGSGLSGHAARDLRPRPLRSLVT